jgi:cell division GTPase FtsZ
VVIKVVGIGGGGVNAVNRTIDEGLKDADMVLVTADEGGGTGTGGTGGRGRGPVNYCPLFPGRPRAVDRARSSPIPG